MGFYEIKENARRLLHDKMKRPALYLVDGDPPAAIHVRVHSDWAALGKVQGVSFNYAEKEDTTPSIIFLAEEVPAPVRNAKIIVSASEGWMVDHTLPQDGITITARAKRMTAAQMVGQPYPGDDSWPLTLF